MTTFVRQYMGGEVLENVNLPAPSEDPDDYSPLYAAMLARIKELGLKEGDEPVRIARLLRQYEDMGLDWLDLEGYPEPETESWEVEDAELRARDFRATRF